jgi:esterase/lipase
MLAANNLTIDSNKGYNNVFNNKNDVPNNKIKNKNIFKKFSKKFLSESFSAIKAGVHFPVSLKNRLNSYNVNLKKITKEQSTKSPILLLHGNYGYWGYFLNLIKAIKKNNLGPIYTVSLSHGFGTCPKDFGIVEKKIEEIKKQYKKHNIKNPKINFIGYSRGGVVLDEFYKKRKWKNIKKIITIGCPISPDPKKTSEMLKLKKKLLKTSKEVLKLEKEKPKNLERKILELKKEIKTLKDKKKKYQKKIFEITGKYDLLVPEKSKLPQNKKFDANTGHFGLLFSKKVHNKIINWLKKP